jgi:hypothetical protein
MSALTTASQASSPGGSSSWQVAIQARRSSCTSLASSLSLAAQAARDAEERAQRLVLKHSWPPCHVNASESARKLNLLRRALTENQGAADNAKAHSSQASVRLMARAEFDAYGELPRLTLSALPPAVFSAQCPLTHTLRSLPLYSVPSAH